jgi:hypothetical protein
MVARICLGRRLGSSEYGLYISRPGADVLTCADEDLNFSSDRPTLQIMENGENTFDTQADTVVVNHTDWGEVLYLFYRTSKPDFSYGITFRSRTQFRLVTNAGDSRYTLYWTLLKIPGL